MNQKKYAINWNYINTPNDVKKGEYLFPREIADTLMQAVLENSPNELRLTILKSYLDLMVKTDEQAVEMIKISLIPWMNHFHPTIEHRLVEEPV